MQTVVVAPGSRSVIETVPDGRAASLPTPLYALTAAERRAASNMCATSQIAIGAALHATQL